MRVNEVLMGIVVILIVAGVGIWTILGILAGPIFCENYGYDSFQPGNAFKDSYCFNSTDGKVARIRQGSGNTLLEEGFNGKHKTG